jgi:hypothetical protein
MIELSALLKLHKAMVICRASYCIRKDLFANEEQYKLKSPHHPRLFGALCLFEWYNYASWLHSAAHSAVLRPNYLRVAY